MHRRDLLVASGSVAVLAGGGWIAMGGPNRGSRRVEPVTIETVDARGSTAGTMQVPRSGTITVLDLFSTFCTSCAKQLESLQKAFTATSGDVQFVSVTNQSLDDSFTRRDLARWWRDNGGSWPVGVDPDGRFLRRLKANAVPYTAVFGADQRVTWGAGGVTDPDTIREHVSAARAATDTTDR